MPSLPDLSRLAPPLIQTPVTPNGPRLGGPWQSWFAQTWDKLNAAFFGGWQTYTMSVTGAGLTISGVSQTIAQYYILGGVCHVNFYITFTTAGSGVSVNLSLPFPSTQTGATIFTPVTGYNTTGAGTQVPVIAGVLGSALSVYAGGTTNQNYSAGSHTLVGQFFYPINT